MISEISINVIEKSKPESVEKQLQNDTNCMIEIFCQKSWLWSPAGKARQWNILTKINKKWVELESLAR